MSGKIIQINPDLFKISSTNKSRKTTDKKIRIKSPNTSTIKNRINHNILKHIRNKQQELFNTTEQEGGNPTNGPEQKFDSDFTKALTQLNNLSLGKPSTSMVNGSTHNKTLKPSYGCLKGGSLPTFRTWKQQTQKNVIPSPSFPQNIQNIQFQPTNGTMPNFEKLGETNTMIPFSQENFSGGTTISKPSFSETAQLKQKQEKEHEHTILLNKQRKPTTQRKTLKRKFLVGKSKVYSKVGVLIGNKTLRNRTREQSQKIKDTPIQEIKRVLVKKGLIKVGSNSPPDVLRKMYDSVMMIVGDVQNHNTENLLYNYLNGDKH